jgi:hypothetical protein
MSTDSRSELLVPPRRLGNLLAQARITGGYSLEEACGLLGDGWDPLSLLEVETGRRRLDDREVEQLASAYEIQTSMLIPQRSRLVIDINEGTMLVGGQEVAFGRSEPERNEVLARYLSMVYVMRGIEPGTVVPLRRPDLEVLESVFSVERTTIEQELEELMVDATGSVTYRTRRLSGRLLVPIVGVVVAATTAGVLLLVNHDAGASAVPAGSDPVEVQIGQAVVQERLPDGSPGPVVPRY